MIKTWLFLRRLAAKVKGFTIPEVLTASTIMVLVLSGIIGVHLSLRTAWLEGIIRMNLARQARTAMERMVRGFYGRDGIREAESVLPSNAAGVTDIRYTSGTSGNERRFYLSGDKIMYDPDTQISGNESTVAENIRTNPSGLMFSTSTGNGIVFVIISLTLEDQALGRTINTELVTQVKLRN